MRRRLRSLSAASARSLFPEGTSWHPLLRKTVAHNARDRKSTRLNSSHLGISYAVFCLKKKKKTPSKRPTMRKNLPMPSPAKHGHHRTLDDCSPQRNASVLDLRKAKLRMSR